MEVMKNTPQVQFSARANQPFLIQGIPALSTHDLKRKPWVIVKQYKGEYVAIFVEFAFTGKHAANARAKELQIEELKKLSNQWQM